MAKKTGEKVADIEYDPEESESEAGTPKKWRKKNETPDPGLTMGTDIADHLNPDGKQAEVELDNVRIVKKVPTRTGPRCAPSACYPC